MRVGVSRVSMGMRGWAGSVRWRAVATRGDRPRGLWVPTSCRGLEGAWASGALTRGFAAAPGPAVGDAEKALKALKSLAETEDKVDNLKTDNNEEETPDEKKANDAKPIGDATEETPGDDGKADDRKADDGKANNGKPNTSTPKVAPKPGKEDDSSWRKRFGESTEWTGAQNVVQLMTFGAAVAALVLNWNTSRRQIQSEDDRADEQRKADLNKPEIVFKNNVSKAFARLSETFVYEETGDLSKHLDHVDKSGAPEDVKAAAKKYLTLGIDMPSKLEIILTSKGDDLFRPTAVEGMPGEGKTTRTNRTLNELHASGFLYVTCKQNAKIWQCMAEALNLTDVKDDDVRAIMMEALRKYKRETGKIPTIIVDDMHYALEDDERHTKAFLAICSAAFDKGTFNSIFLGSGRVKDKIDALNVPGLRARLKRTDFLSRNPKEIAGPLANFLSVIFAQSKINDEASITPAALLPLADDILTLLGPRYLDLQKLHRATSPADAKRIVVDLIRDKTGVTARNVGPGSICRALVESDAGMFTDTNGKYDGAAHLKGLDGKGKPSDLETLQLVRMDDADVGNSVRPRFRPHHGAAFVAMASDVRDAHPDVKLGKAAVDALAVYDRFVRDTKDRE